jgi:hypothetical protein
MNAQQSLIEAMVDCLGYGHVEAKTAARGQHAIVMRRFRRVLEENPDQSIYVPELCQAIRVPDRTLRGCIWG